MTEPFSVGVFCGAHHGAHAGYERSARDLAAAIAEIGGRLVYGGAGVGLMGVVADGCLAAGVEVIGVIPDFLVHAEVAHGRVPDLRIVGSIAERKELIMDLADVFVVLPGGLGTMDELLEVLTLRQLGRTRKPTGLLDPEGYFGPLLEQFRLGHDRGFIAADATELLSVSADARDLLRTLHDQEARRS
jgi:hypothetical protein